MPCQIKLTLEKALVLLPLVTSTFIHKGGKDVTILTVSQDPLFIVSVKVSKSQVLESCPYNLFNIDTLDFDRGYTLSCTGTLSQVQWNKAPECDYTFFSIYVEGDDSITFDNIALDTQTKKLLRTLSYSIYTVRSDVEEEYGLQWQFEHVSSTSDTERLSSKSSQEVYELDDDTTEEVNVPVKNDTIKKVSLDTPQYIDDDDFQKPLVVRSTRNKKKTKTNNAPGKKTSRRKQHRKKEDDDDDFKLHIKKSHVVSPLCAKRITRGARKNNN
ncbi:unnamed protein product [Mucor hiemalis]